MAMPKYKHGDRVRVVSDISCEDGARWYMDDHKEYAYVTEEMEDYRGKVVTIDYPNGDDGYYIMEDGNSYCWTDSMLTPVEAITERKESHKVNLTKPNTENKKESFKMKFNMKKLLSQYMPHAINDGSVALSINGDIAYRRSNGDYVFFDPESKSINNCMDLVIGSEALDKMVFVMPVKSVAIGDVVLNNGKYVYITNITEAGNIKGVNLESGRTATLVKEINTIMGCLPYAKVTSLFSMMNGKGAEGINPMFLMMLGDADGEDDLFSTIAMMTMMGGTSGASAATGAGLFGGGMMNPLLLMALSGDDSDGSGDDSKGYGSVVKMMLLSQMMGGGLFQAPVAAPAPDAQAEG